MSLYSALTRNRARTSPDAADPALRTRRYAVPYQVVWSAVLRLAQESSRWAVTAADARAGTLHAEARTRIWKFVDDVAIAVALDADGFTVVEMASASRVGRADLGVNARRVRRFLRRLDAALGARR